MHADSSDPISDLLASCLRASKEEQRVLLDEACAKMPEHEAELRERFEILVGLGIEELAMESSSGGETGTGPGFGDFELVEILGEGGMGIVHRARQKSLDRDVVVKLIRPELLHFGSSRRRFEREANAVARLEHPGIVPIHAVGEHEGVPWFAMAWIDGRSLDQCLKDVEGRSKRGLRARDLSPGLANEFGASTWTDGVLAVGRQIAAALHHAHSRGIVHRDVKPSNVLIDAHGRAHVIDFGLHGVSDDDHDRSRLTREGSAPGTLLYMPPEQIDEGVHDARSEVYSLGATLYELLAFEPPYRGDSRSTTERLIRDGRVAALRTKNPSVPADVEAVIHRALSPDPSRRYVDMRAFEDDLQRAMEGRPVAARPDGTMYRLRRWAGRHRALAAASAALIVFAVAAPTIVIVQQKKYTKELETLVENERLARLDAEDMAEFAIGVLSAHDANQSAPSDAVRRVLDAGVAQAEARLGDRPLRRAHVEMVLGRIHGQLGLAEESMSLLSASADRFSAELERMESDPTSHAEDIELARGGVINAYHHLAHLQESRRLVTEALESRRRIVTEMRKVHPDGSWEVLHTVANALRLALLAPAGTVSEEERPTVDEVLEAHRVAVAAHEASGDDDLDALARAYGWLGSNLVSRGQSERDPATRDARFTEALDNLRESIDTFERAGLADTLEAAQALNALGVAAKRLGENEEAQAAYARAIGIFEQRLGTDDVNVAILLSNTAGLDEQLGDFGIAIEKLRRAAAILSDKIDPLDQRTVQVEGNLCGTRFRGGDHDGLADAYDALIPKQVEAFGPTHKFVGTSHLHRGVLRRDLDRFDEALEDARAAHPILVAAHGADNSESLRAKALIDELSVED